MDARRPVSSAESTCWKKLDHQQTTIGSSMNERLGSLRPDGSAGCPNSVMYRGEAGAARRGSHFALSSKSMDGVSPSQH
jgi:hypothetical protein